MGKPQSNVSISSTWALDLLDLDTRSPPPGHSISSTWALHLLDLGTPFGGPSGRDWRLPLRSKADSCPTDCEALASARI
jgi:hypothetical protein